MRLLTRLRKLEEIAAEQIRFSKSDLAKYQAATVAWFAGEISGEQWGEVCEKHMPRVARALRLVYGDHDEEELEELRRSKPE